MQTASSMIWSQMVVVIFDNDNRYTTNALNSTTIPQSIALTITPRGHPQLNSSLVWFVWFYGISTFVGFLTPNSFLCK